MIEVIIPVGPGHEQVAVRAVNSVRVAVDTFCEHKVRVSQLDDTKGENGRSATRNAAVRDSDADWLFFLDADDMLHPMAFMLGKYFDRYDAIWGTRREMQGHYLCDVFELPVITSRETLLRHHPTQTLIIGHFVKREVALRHPFNEDMDCGEDFDYYLRIWEHENCIKVPEPAYIKIAGQHSQGPRSATGRQWSETVDAMLEEARAA